MTHKWIPLLVLLGFASGAEAKFYAQFEGVLPGFDGIGRPERPTSVTVNPTSQEICVTDGGSQTLLVYNQHNTPTFRTEGVARMSSPMDAAIEKWGGFACTDRDESGGRTIRRFNLFGEPIPFEAEKPNSDWYPGHIIVTNDGNYVTVDERTSLLAKHNSESGELIWKASLPFEAPERGALLGRPAEAQDGRIFVPGGELRRVLVFSGDGRYLDSFGEGGSGAGELAFPVGVAFTYRGMVLVLDRMRHTMLLYDSDRKFLGELGSWGGRPGTLYHPLSIAALPNGRIWVAQGFRGRVQAFRLMETGTEGSREPKASS